MAIRRKGDKFEVTTEDGSRVLGTHDTRAEAVKQLQAIEISKAMRRQSKRKTRQPS